MSSVAVLPDASHKAIVLSEDSLAEAFVLEHVNRVLYAHIFKQWHIYDPENGIWHQDGMELVEHWIREFIRDLNSEQQVRWAKAAVVDAVAKFARRAPQISVSGLEFDRDPWTLGTPDGPYDLRSAERIEPGPGLMISKSTSVRAAADEPRLWLSFLNDATGADCELIDYLQRFCGYSLTGHSSEESLTFFYGPGGNGKGVFLGTLLAIAGDYGRQASMDTFTRSRGDRHPVDLASLAGARIVVAAEASEGARWDEQRIKMLTGRDRIAARFMRGNMFEFTPAFNIAISSNHTPRIGTVDDAWRRRMQLVPFNQKPERPNPNLKDELRSEYPQILRWIIDGAEWWAREGLAPPACVTAATDEYLAEEDVCGIWFRERCKPTASTVKAHRADLYASFSRWCDEMGHAAATQHKLTRWLKAQGFMQATSSQDRQRPFFGIRLI